MIWPHPDALSPSSSARDTFAKAMILHRIDGADNIAGACRIAALTARPGPPHRPAQPPTSHLTVLPFTSAEALGPPAVITVRVAGFERPAAWRPKWPALPDPSLSR